MKYTVAWKNATCLAIFLSVALCGCGARPPKAEKAAPANYGQEAIEWQITPDVAAEIAEMRAKTQYRPHRTPTRVFVRTQLKYGLERNDYLHKWYDRPLMGDVTYRAADEKGHSINIESWKRMVELARMCGHGFSAFTISSGREDILRRSVLPGYETGVMVETVIGGSSEDGFSNRFKLAMQRIEEALAATNTFRIDGKLILTSYPAIRVDKLDTYRKIKEEIVRRWGDKVALMPYFSPFRLETRRPFDKKELEIVKDNLRKALRVIDGLCFSLETVINHDRRTNPRFAVEVAAPIIHSVLSEPEFKDKFFGMTVSCGHENCYRWNYAKDCTGTRRLRDNYEAVLAMKPDFINATEWDEENENTHHRPTIAQGFVQQRLLRHATRTLNGEAQEPLPGDDTSIPNLVVSYRKALLAGEPIEVEVLNIPDGTFKGKEFTVRFAWKDLSGAVVKSYPPRRLSADELKAAWFVTDATELLDNPILKPELTVWFDGQEKTLSDGFWPLSLHANRTLDFRWAKQPIREKTANVKSSLKVGAPLADGTREVTGFVESPAALRSVEVLDGPDTVYVFDPKNPNPHADGSLTVRVTWQGLPCSDQLVSGKIRLVGAPKAVLSGKALNAIVKEKEKEIVFVKARLSGWPMCATAEIPADEVETAVFEVEAAPHFAGKVRAKDLLVKDIVSMPSVCSMNLVFRRWLTPRALPPPCGGNRAEFSFKVKPNSPDAVLRIQTVDEKYNVDYGASLSLVEPAGEKVAISAFERDSGKVTRTHVDANRLVECCYTFSPERGGVVSSGAGLGLDGILCGYTPLVAGFGTAESSDGNVIREHNVANLKSPGWPKTVPEYVREEDGSWSLKFDNSSYVTLPQQVVPEYAGFEIEMEVRPDEVERRQGLFTTGHAYFNLGIAKGRVFAELFLRNGYMDPKMKALNVVWGPKIKAGEWSRVRVKWDRETCRIDVNGEKGEPVKISGDLFYAQHSALGALTTSDTFYKGRIRKVRTSISSPHL